jgi:four helix bundle protein
VVGGKKVESYRDLVVWQRSMALATGIYDLTRRFPADERLGLVAQKRRSAISVPSNIAEGQARHTTKEFIHAISNAEGSLAELQAQLSISAELGLSQGNQVSEMDSLADEIRRMLNSLRRKLATRV